MKMLKLLVVGGILGSSLAVHAEDQAVMDFLAMNQEVAAP